jgi:DNA-binding transcriptional LysR family regulator
MEEDIVLKGEVYLGIPIEYGNSFIMPLVSSFAKDHPQVTFRFFYGHASQVNHMLLKGELDFAIVDSYAMDSQIETLEVGFEIHTLCGSKDYLNNFGSPSATKEFLSRLDYIAYLDGAPVLSEWFKHYIKKSCFEGRIKATLMDVQGVAQLILHGLGVGILPRHLVDKINRNGDRLYSFTPQGEPLLNRLSLAHLKGRTLSYPSQALEEHLKNNLKSYA